MNFRRSQEKQKHLGRNTNLLNPVTTKMLKKYFSHCPLTKNIHLQNYRIKFFIQVSVESFQLVKRQY